MRITEQYLKKILKSFLAKQPEKTREHKLLIDYVEGKVKVEF